MLKIYFNLNLPHLNSPRISEKLFNLGLLYRVSYFFLLSLLPRQRPDVNISIPN